MAEWEERYRKLTDKTHAIWEALAMIGETEKGHLTPLQGFFLSSDPQRDVANIRERVSRLLQLEQQEDRLYAKIRGLCKERAVLLLDRIGELEQWKKGALEAAATMGKEGVLKEGKYQERIRYLEDEIRQAAEREREQERTGYPLTR